MSSVKIIFLGTGDYANNGGKANQAIWIQAQDSNILLECGPTTLHRIQNQKLYPDNLDAILLTHFHGDHFAGIVFLDLALTLEWSRKKSIMYAGPKGLKEKFIEMYKVCYNDFYPNYQFTRNFVEYLPMHTYEFKNIKIFPISMKHRKESLGYKIQIGNKIIAFTGDTAWNMDILPLSKDTDLLITECTFYQKKGNANHISYEEIERYASLIQTKRMVLTHVGKEVLENKNKIQWEIMEDGQEILL